MLEAALERLQRRASGTEDEALILANLSRALMRSGSFARTLEVADQALALGERLNLERIVAEAFVNKGAALQYVGRRRESAAVVQVALDMARARGWIPTELRATNNLAFNLTGDDPRRATELLREGIALARRIGNRSMTTWAVGSLGYTLFHKGEDWEGALALLDEVLSWPLEAQDRLRQLGALTQMRAARGEPVQVMLDELDALVSGNSDPQLIAGTETVRAEVGLAVGDFSSTYRAANRSVEALPGFASIALPIAMRAAIWAGAGEDVRATAQRIGALAQSEATTRAHQDWAGAAVAAFDDRLDDAPAGFRNALAGLREIGQQFELARVGLDMTLLLGPDHSEVPAVAAEARAIFERLGARPYVERLEGALAAAPSRSAVETVKAR